MTKINVAILCGGKSSEHEISLLSAVSVLKALPRKKYKVVPIGIDKQGLFYFYKKEPFIENQTNPKKIHLSKNGHPVTFALDKQKRIFLLDKKHSDQK